MKVNSKQFVKAACIACITFCIGDFVVMFFMGKLYPGYSQLKNTISSLGASISPVSAEMSIWWIIVGVIFIFFGFGFQKAFYSKGKIAVFASWLIILYGIGEGIGTGAFKADYYNNTLRTSAIIHDTFGAVGIGAIIILPLLMKKIIPGTEFPRFKTISMIVFFIGIGMLLLFSFRFSDQKNNFLKIYVGLWQRLMMLNIYVYLTTIAFIMFKKASRIPNDVHELTEDASD